MHDKIIILTSMISSRADFFFFSPLESELEDVSFLLADGAALRALAARAELQRDRKLQYRQNNSFICAWCLCSTTLKVCPGVYVPGFGRTSSWGRCTKFEGNWKENTQYYSIYIKKRDNLKKHQGLNQKQTFFFFALALEFGVNWSFLKDIKINIILIEVESLWVLVKLKCVPLVLTSVSLPSWPLRTCSSMNFALLSSSSSSCLFFLACSSWRRMVSGSRSMYWIYQPFGVSSTLQKPGTDI